MPSPMQFRRRVMYSGADVPPLPAGAIAIYFSENSYSDTALTTLQTTNNGAVNSIADTSGNGYNQVNGYYPTANSNFVYLTNQLNGYPALYCSSQAYSIGFRAAFTLAAPITAFIIVNPNTLNNNYTLMDGYNFFSAVAEGNPSSGGRISGNSNFSTGLDNPAATTGVWQLWTCIFNGASSSIQIGNGAPITGTISTSNMGGISFGCQGGLAGSPAAAKYMGQIIFPGVLNSTQIAAVQAFVYGKYPSLPT